MSAPRGPLDLRAVEDWLENDIRPDPEGYVAKLLAALRETRAALAEIVNAPTDYQRDTGISWARRVLASVTDGPEAG